MRNIAGHPAFGSLRNACIDVTLARLSPAERSSTFLTALFRDIGKIDLYPHRRGPHYIVRPRAQGERMVRSLLYIAATVNTP